METRIPLDVVLLSVAAMGALLSLIWRDQSRRIGKVEEQCRRCSFPNIKADLAVLKTDIDWIKLKLSKM